MTTDENTQKPAEETSRPFPSWSDLLAFLGIFLLCTLAGGLLIAPLMKLSGSVSEQAAAFAGYSVQFALTIALTLMYRRSRGGKGKLFRFSMKWFNAALILWGVVLVFLIGIVIEPLLDIFPDSYMELLNNAIGQGGWAVATAVIAAPIMEEMLFRGIVLESVRSRFGSCRAILISAAAFGLVHIIPQQMINAFLVGIVLGFIYVRTESLISVIILHAVNNALAYLQTTVFGQQELSVKELTGGGTLYWVIYGISAAVCILALIQLIRYAAKSETAPAAKDNNSVANDVDNR